MDGIFSFLVIIGIVNAIIKWARKQAAANQKGQGAAPEKPWQQMMGGMVRTLEEAVTGKTSGEAAPPAPAYKTLKSPVYREGISGGGAGASPSSIAGLQTPYIVGGETAASPYSLTGEGTSRPLEPLPQWHGSLPGTEGAAAFTMKTPDTSLAPEPAQEAQPALNLSFGRDSLMQAVVMHEILTRPQDNRRRRWMPR